MSSNIPNQQTGRNQKVEVSVCFCVDSASLFLVSSSFSRYLTVQSKQNDHREEAHWPQLRHGHHGHSTWIDDERQPRPYVHKYTAQKKKGFAWYLLKCETIRFQNDSNQKKKIIKIWWETVGFTDIECNSTNETAEILKTKIIFKHLKNLCCLHFTAMSLDSPCSLLAQWLMLSNSFRKCASEFGAF